MFAMPAVRFPAANNRSGIVRRLKRSFLLGTLCWLSLPGWGKTADTPGDLPQDLTQLSLEELMNIEITSVSRKPESMGNAAAAVFVITHDDLRRSGAQNIPEALRMVPGLEVARIDTNKWAVTSRGFNDFFANKLLVLMDGRTLYTPLFSGVFWDAQEIPLEDVERIEVIRGPGASLWGANAVNGVINIITKSAAETQGSLLSLGIGTEDRYTGYYRYGGRIGDAIHYRAYVKSFSRDGFVDAKGRNTDDGWDEVRGGFRADARLSETDTLTLQSDAFHGEFGSTFLRPIPADPFTEIYNESEEVAGAYLLARWNRALSPTSDLSLRLYYDWTQRDSVIFGERRNVFDTELQHLFAPTDRQEIVWGLGYRYTGDDIENSFTYSFDPDSRADNLFSAFVHDEITLVEDRLHLMLGTKLEHNDYSGFEIQPSARLLWTPLDHHTLWAAVSRAVRTPSRSDHDGQTNLEFTPQDPRNPLPFPVIVHALGTSDFDSEEVLAYELGYRFLAADTLSLDAALFYNDYNRLRSAEMLPPDFDSSPVPGHLFVPALAGNRLQGETYGSEFAVDWRVQPWWNLRPAYTFLQMQLHPEPGGTDFLLESAEGESPHHQLSLRSSMDLTRRVELDVWLRSVDNLPSFSIPGYTVLDVRASWKPKNNLELVAGARNLLDDRHPEYRIRSRITEIESSLYVKLQWQF